MAITDNTFYKTKDVILGQMLDTLLASVPDAYTGSDGILRILLEVMAGQHETNFLSNQLLLEDVFITTASLTALRLHAADLGEDLKDGTKSNGTLIFTGQQGTYVPFNTEVAYDPGTGADPVYFVTTTDATIPNVGTPTNLSATTGAAGAKTGTYIYKVTFYTAQGESISSPDSNAVILSAQNANLTNIPLGGPATVGRKIYRQKNGTGDYKLITTITNNTGTTFTDNVDDATATSNPSMPTGDTANQISVLAEAQETGVEGNVLTGTITALTNAPNGLTDVTNPTPFTGGSDPEDTEDFRQRLLERVRSPGTGSPSDLKSWAEEVDGVEQATVFPNDNLGTPTNGHVTVRISGEGGAVPSAGLIADVQTHLDELDLANATIHVAGFTQQATNVTVALTLVSGYTHTDVDPGVALEIAEYLNDLPVGAGVYITGIIAAIVGTPGVLDVTVSVPATNLSTASTTKRIPGTISIT